MNYKIDSNEPSELFLHTRQIAGATLEELFKSEAGRVDDQLDYRWIKSDLTWPSFDHLTFAYRNQIFSVLVCLEGENGPSLTQAVFDRCKEACAINNLIPCVFYIDAESLSPRKSGWNLLHLETGESVVPSELVTDEKILMSEWEQRNFCIQIVRDQLSSKGNGTVLSYCDVLEVDPQIWFENDSGDRGWILVRPYPVITGNEKEEWIGFEKSNPQLQQYDGYFAAVSLASSEPALYDLKGNLIPLSERFTGKAPIYRGDGFYVKFDGIQRIYVC